MVVAGLEEARDIYEAGLKAEPGSSELQSGLSEALRRLGLRCATEASDSSECAPTARHPARPQACFFMARRGAASLSSQVSSQPSAEQISSPCARLMWRPSARAVERRVLFAMRS